MEQTTKDPDCVFEWQAKTDRFMKFAREYESKLPVVIMLLEGYLAPDEEHTVYGDQILRIEQMERQNRVIAKNRHGYFLSLPCCTKYPTAVHVLQGDKPVGKPQFLTEVVRLHPWHTQVKLVEDKGHMGPLELVRMHEEIFFIGNCVDPKGHLYPVVVVIPAYIDVAMVVAQGLRDRPHSEWEALLRTFEECAKHINFNQVKAGQDINMYDRSLVKTADDINPYVEPAEYVRLPVRLPRFTSTDDTVKGKPAVKPRGNKPATNTRPLPATPAQPGVVLNKAGVYQSLTMAKSAGSTVQENLYSELHEVQRQKQLQQQQQTRPDKPPTGVAQVVGAVAPSVVAAAQQPTSPSGKFNTIHDVPKDVSTLSTHEVGDCLKLLKLEKHADAFVDNQIDGEMLQNLDEGILVNDLGLNTLSARKLIMFVKDGWRPK